MTLSAVTLEGWGMVERGAKALGKAWGVNMGLGDLRILGFSQEVERLKKLMEDEVRLDAQLRGGGILVVQVLHPFPVSGASF